MLDFEKYLTRFGEYGVQALVEQIERVEKVYTAEGCTLEQRWHALMQISSVKAA